MMTCPYCAWVGVPRRAWRHAVFEEALTLLTIVVLGVVRVHDWLTRRDEQTGLKRGAA